MASPFWRWGAGACGSSRHRRCATRQRNNTGGSVFFELQRLVTTRYERQYSINPFLTKEVIVSPVQVTKRYVAGSTKVIGCRKSMIISILVGRARSCVRYENAASGVMRFFRKDDRKVVVGTHRRGRRRGSTETHLRRRPQGSAIHVQHATFNAHPSRRAPRASSPRASHLTPVRATIRDGAIQRCYGRRSTFNLPTFNPSPLASSPLASRPSPRT